MQFSSVLDIMARRFFHSQNLAFGLSLVLFTFMLLPTFLILSAVVVFFVLTYLRLRKSDGIDHEGDVQPSQHGHRE